MAMLQVAINPLLRVAGGEKHFVVTIPKSLKLVYINPGDNKKDVKVHLIYIEKFRGETKEQAVKRYEAANNIDSKSSNDMYLFMLIPSDEQIKMELKK